MNDPTNSQSLNTNTTPHNSYLQPTLSIAHNNVISFSDYTKRFQIINEALSNNINILGLSETNLTSKQSKFIHKELLPNYYSVFNSAPDKCKGTGVTILLKPSIASHIIKSKGNLGRYVYVDLAFKRQMTIRIFQIYLHTSPSDIHQRVSIQNEICQEIINAKSLGYEIVIMGDFNFNYHVPDRQRANYLKKSAFFHSLQGYNLIDINASMRNNLDTSYTWKRNTSKSILDYIWLSQNLLQYFVYKKYQFPTLYRSDHVIMTLIIDSTKFFKRPSSAYDRNHNVKKKVYLYKDMTKDSWIKFAEYLDNTVSRDQVLRTIHNVANITSKNHLNSFWTHWRDLVIKAADSHIPHIMTTTKSDKYVPKALRIIQKCIRSTNHILSRFKKCFIKRHDDISS